MNITFVGQLAGLNAHSYLSDGNLRASAESEHRDPVGDAMRRAGAERLSAIKPVAAGATAGAASGVSSGESSTLQQILHRVRTAVPSSLAIGDGADSTAFTSTGEVGRLIEYLSTVALALGAKQAAAAEPDPEVATQLATVEQALLDARSFAADQVAAADAPVVTLDGPEAAAAATEQTKTQIVTASASALSAQANSAPEMVLSLLGAAA